MESQNFNQISSPNEYLQGAIHPNMISQNHSTQQNPMRVQTEMRRPDTKQKPKTGSRSSNNSAYQMHSQQYNSEHTVKTED